MVEYLNFNSDGFKTLESGGNAGLTNGTAKLRYSALRLMLLFFNPNSKVTIQ
jgi:hypothetical protein